VKQVHEHPDNFINVRVDALTYSDSRENFETDFGVQLPPLPEGAFERIYDQGRRHAFQGDNGLVCGGEMPWPLGDQLIDSVEAGLSSQAIRKAIEEAELEAQRAVPSPDQRIPGNLTVEGNLIVEGDLIVRGKIITS
jgi:hypothetical protein